MFKENKGGRCGSEMRVSMVGLGGCLESRYL